uniref:Putative monolaris n=1 Tax=Rhipicephalus pulchellus TaxID=72859 RepID=L7LQC7_RHIPC
MKLFFFLVCVIAWSQLPSTSANENKPCEDKVFRYGYNATTKKCLRHKLKNCRFIQGTQYETREECYKKSDAYSKCVDTSYSKYHEEGPRVQGVPYYYYYDASWDDCVEIQVNVPFSPSELWPKENLFLIESRCQKECMPKYRKAPKV